jgi:hypothetical protein
MAPDRAKTSTGIFEISQQFDIAWLKHQWNAQKSS